ncbi:MAG: hypothetical protein WCF95_07535 [bacterium]
MLGSRAFVPGSFGPLPGLFQPGESLILFVPARCRRIGIDLVACLVHELERGLEGLQEAFHGFAKDDDGPPVETFALAGLALDDAEKNVTVSILFYVEEICSAIAGKSRREKLSSNTH